MADWTACLVALALAVLIQCGGGSNSKAASGASAGPPPSGLAVYVYSDLVTDVAAREAFFVFAQTQNIHRVYLQSASFIGASPNSLGDFIAEAKSHAIAVTLLFGQAAWTLAPNQASAQQYVTQSLSFLAGLQAAGRPAPDAIQFDVEPYVLPQWTTDLQGTANQYLDLLAALRNQINGQLVFTVTIPFWLDAQPVTRNGQTRPMSEWIIDAVDGVVMLDYRNHAQAILDGASSELVYASAQGKSLTIVVDVQCGSDGTITFCGEGEAFMFQEMATVEASARNQSAYSGLGVFDYEDWLLLGP